MSDTQHTPGPWTVEQSISAPCIAFVHAPCHRVIADVWNVPNTKGAQALKDATLIAAAPDLLQSLREMLDRHEQYDEFSTKTHAIHEKARAAVAKAIGMPQQSPNQAKF